MNRRGFLRQVIQTTSFILCSGKISLVFSATSTQHDTLITFSSFLDILLPEDLTPSASQLDIHQTISNHAKNITNYPELINLGCQWLNLNAHSMHTKNFSQLTPDEKLTIVLLAEQSPNNSIAKLFFERIKNDAFNFYYSNPKSWKGLGFYHPPQPLGYLNHNIPPEVIL